MLSDTSPEAEKVQIELLRKATVAERIALVQSFSAWTVGLSRRAIGRANPGLSEEDLDLKFVELHHGRELADRLRRHLKNRKA